jgi:hypothetical protein
MVSVKDKVGNDISAAAATEFAARIRERVDGSASEDLRVGAEIPTTSRAEMSSEAAEFADRIQQRVVGSAPEAVFVEDQTSPHGECERKEFSKLAREFAERIRSRLHGEAGDLYVSEEPQRKRR